MRTSRFSSFLRRRRLSLALLVCATLLPSLALTPDMRPMPQAAAEAPPVAGPASDRVAPPVAQADQTAAGLSQPIFVPNVDPGDSPVRFQTLLGGGTIFFAANEVTFSLPAPRQVGDSADMSRHVGDSGVPNKFGPPPAAPTVLRVRFEGANPAAVVAGAERLPGVMNSFLGNDPSKWRRGIPLFSGIVYRQLYPGVDLTYQGGHGQLKGTYVVAPHADPAAIRWRYDGATDVRLDAEGNLRIGLSPDADELSEHAPIAWQEIRGRRMAVSAAYTLAPDGSVTFALGRYDPSYPLTIDPTLEYSGYLGWGGESRPMAVTTDHAGNVIVVGTFDTVYFPAWTPAIGPQGAACFDNTNGLPEPCPDAFVLKLDPNGTVLMLDALGGNHNETALAVTVDAQDNIYVTGGTHSSDFPTTTAIPAGDFTAACEQEDEHQSRSHWSLVGRVWLCDTFVTRFDGHTGDILFSSFVDVAGYPSLANAIGLDSGGNIWLAGSVDDGSNPSRPYKPYLLKLRPDALEQLYYTASLISGNGQGYGLALDRSDRAWVVGTEYVGQDDNAVFIARADGQGGTETHFMTGKAIGYGIAVDPDGNAYITGITESPSFVTYLDPQIVSASNGTAKVLQSSLGGDEDAFVAKWTPDFDLAYSTFLGGSAYDAGRAITVDSGGNAFVLGFTRSTDFPTLDSIQKYVNYNRSDCGGACWVGSSDAFIAKVNRFGTALLYSTYLGGETPTEVIDEGPDYSSEDFGLGLALDRWGKLWATGYTYAGGFPLAGNPLITYKAGWTVAGWLARLKGDALPVVVVPGAAASVLVDAGGVEYWPNIGGTTHDQLTLYDVPHPTLHPADILREVWIPGQSASTYGPLLDFLKQKGYREYDHHNQPQYRTSAGCDFQVQQYSSPHLFVFPYDWRLDNAENVARLADYVGCVRQFYPDSEVNLVAHSMGGLLSRRYILDHPNDNHVNALISVGSPYLGAPKMISVEETGDFLPFVADATIKSIAGSFNGVSELLPSQGWFTIGGPSPMADWDTDHDGNGVLTESYSYNQLVYHMDLGHGRGLFFPGYMNRSFHSYATDKGTQDNWSSDKTGVRYYHIYGINPANDTIGQVVATTMWHCLWDEGDCYQREWMLRKFTQGDVTVPALSASRVGPGGDYNAPKATLMACEGSEANDSDTEHTAMLSNPVVQSQIVQFLAEADGASPQPLPDPQDCGKGLVQPAAALAATAGANRTSLAGPARMAADTDLAPTFYLLLDGADAITVSDAQGDNAALEPDGMPGAFPGLSAFPMADHAWQMAMAVSGAYTITFGTIDRPLFLELTEGAQVTATQAIRYRDIALPAGITTTLTIVGEAVGPLRYDADGDGAFESVVTPTAALTGDAANDLMPPDVTITGAVETDTIAVTVAAVDSGTGVSRTVYSLDGAHFQAYTGTLHLDPDQVRTVYAFADDNAANRSTLAAYYLPSFTDPDLAIILGHVGAFVAGGTGAYTMTVSNAGLVAVNGAITVTDTLPPELSFVSASGSGWSCANASATVTCTVTAALAVGASLPDLTLTVNVSDDAWPVVENRAAVSITQDAAPTNDHSRDLTPISPRADLTLSIAHDGFFAVGATESYTLAVNNLGPLPTDTPITVTDILPPGLTYYWFDGANWMCSVDGQTVTCTHLGPVAGHGWLPELILQVSVDATATPDVTNAATVTSGTADPDTGNNGASDPTPVRYEADLRLEKSHCHMEGENEVCDPFLAGGTSAYRMTVANRGPSPFNGTVIVSDTLTAGLTFASVEGSDWSCGAVGQLVTCTYTGSAPQWNSLPDLSLYVNVGDDVPVTFTNTAAITSTVYDPELSLSNQASDATQGTHMPVTATITITLAGGNVVLHWQCDWADIWYEVWRGDAPYFVPGDEHSVRLDALACMANHSVMAFTDSTAGGANYTYVVRAVNRIYATADSSLVGKFEYSLTPGQ